MPPESEPLRLRQWKPVSLPAGVLMALTHGLGCRALKRWQIRDEILGDALEEGEETEVTHSRLTLWQALCRVCCTQPLVDMSRHHEARLWFLQMGPLMHRESKILFKCRGPRGLTAPLCLCGCKVLGDGLPLPSRDSFQQTARVLVSSQFKKWPEKITSHGRWEVGTGPLGVHFWTENLEGGGAVRGSGSLATALEGKMALHQALYCSSRLLGPRPQTLPQEHGSAGKKASSSSELLCYFWILHHFWSLWPHWEVLLQ